MISIVTTTINVPFFLEGLIRNLNIYNNLKKTNIIVIGDKKTPSDTEDYVKKFKKKIDIRYLSISQQEKYFSSNIDKKNFINFFPYNSGSRKMIGNMIAALEGAEGCIMIDDDNFILDKTDFLKFHKRINNKISTKILSSSTGWFNVHSQLIEKTSIPFYPRGFPWSKRFLNEKMKIKNSKSFCHVNAGLVLNDPDIDAVSRLFWPIVSKNMKNTYGKNFTLSNNTWCPFNDQNTSISKDILKIYYKPLAGGRNSDIYTSFLINKFLKFIGGGISFGQPLVRQDRNFHSFRQDYELEKLSNNASELLIEVLREVEIKNSNTDVLNLFYNFLKECVKITNNKKFDETRYHLSDHEYVPNIKDHKIEFNIHKKYIISYLKEYLEFVRVTINLNNAN